jgi:hypothetical protein
LDNTKTPPVNGSTIEIRFRKKDCYCAFGKNEIPLQSVFKNAFSVRRTQWWIVNGLDVALVCENTD